MDTCSQGQQVAAAIPPCPTRLGWRLAAKLAKPGPEMLADVQAWRIITAARGAESHDESVCVAVEAPITIDIGGTELFTLLCTPGDLPALVLGFLVSEGVIDDPDEVVAIKPCREDPHLVRVRLENGASPGTGKPRHNLVLSSCGLCGRDGIDQKVSAFPRVDDRFAIDAHKLHAATNELREKQVLFDASGGTHAAAVFDTAGQLVAWAEDTGRHNALDKAIGKCLLGGRSPDGLGVVLSGRVSLEMVGKCAWAGLELISAISAPTSLAIEVAERCNITVCAFVREARATVFTHPRRLLAAHDDGG